MFMIFRIASEDGLDTQNQIGRTFHNLLFEIAISTIESAVLNRVSENESFENCVFKK